MAEIQMETFGGFTVVLGSGGLTSSYILPDLRPGQVIQRRRT